MDNEQLPATPSDRLGSRVTLAAALIGGLCAMTTLDPSTDGERHDVRAGEEIALALAEPGATGYAWVLAPGSADCVRLLSSTVERGGPALGAGNRRLFRLVAERPGACTLRLELRRSWEGPEVEPADVFETELNVR